MRWQARKTTDYAVEEVSFLRAEVSRGLRVDDEGLKRSLTSALTGTSV